MDFSINIQKIANGYIVNGSVSDDDTYRRLDDEQHFYPDLTGVQEYAADYIRRAEELAVDLSLRGKEVF